MGEIQGEGYELYRPGDMAMSATKDNRRLIDQLSLVDQAIINRLSELEKRVADLEYRLSEGD